jgi:hypothetical protein
MDNKYYILDGTEVKEASDIQEWAKAYSQNRRIGYHTTVEGVDISTVFLGFNHAWEGEPLLFETMVFGGKHDGFMDRCSTYDEAVEMHRKAVKMCEE